MPDEPIVFTNEQSQIFEQVAAVIRGNRQEFVAAGKWLDSKVNQAKYDDYPDPERPGCKKTVLQTRYQRFCASAIQLLPGELNFARLPAAQRSELARRILLVLWILTDPEDLNEVEQITTHQNWEWGTEGSDPTGEYGIAGSIHRFLVRKKGESEREPGRLFARTDIVDPYIVGITNLAKLALRYAGLPIAAPEAGTVEAVADAGVRDVPAAMEWLAKAMILVRDNPEWSDAKIAGKVGRDKGTLSRSREYQTAAKLARRQQPKPAGRVAIDPDTKTRTVEAVDESEGYESEEERDARIDRETAPAQQNAQRKTNK